MYKYYSFLAIFLLISCVHGEDFEPSDDNELITTVKLTFTPQEQNTGDTPLVFYWKDVQGDGIVDRLDPIELNSETQYDLKLELFDETKSPKEDISEDIEEEADVHLFVYKVLPASLMKVSIKDRDNNGLALGLRSDVKTSSKGYGKLRVQLKHQPPVNGRRIKNGQEDIGSTDVDVEFNLIVK